MYTTDRKLKYFSIVEGFINDFCLLVQGGSILKVRQKNNEKKKKRKQFQFKYKCDVPPTLLENKHRHSKKNIVNLLVEREKKKKRS